MGGGGRGPESWGYVQFIQNPIPPPLGGRQGGGRSGWLCIVRRNPLVRPPSRRTADVGRFAPFHRQPPPRGEGGCFWMERHRTAGGRGRLMRAHSPGASPPPPHSTPFTQCPRNRPLGPSKSRAAESPRPGDEPRSPPLSKIEPPRVQNRAPGPACAGPPNRVSNPAHAPGRRPVGESQIGIRKSQISTDCLSVADRGGEW